MARNAESATLTVTSSADSGAGSLRQAVGDAATGDTITFDASLHGSTITLTSGELSVLRGLTINGPGPSLLTLDGGGVSRIFHLFPSNGTATVTLSGLTLTNGVALTGGAIFSDTSFASSSITLNLSNCVIRANRATDLPGVYAGGGGVAALRNTSLMMTDCEIGSNHANANGGGVWCYSASTFNRCAFVGNTTSNSGGGLLIRHEPVVTIMNSTFSGNASIFYSWQSDYGGGALHTQERGNVRIYNSTITGNTATKQCGGIQSRGTTTMYLVSTIVAGNSDTQGYPDINGLFTGVTNCLIQVTNNVALVGTNNLYGVSPQLQPLAWNGGPTRTHALRSNSPAVDKGANPLGLTVDQRGVGYPRSLGLAVDIGTYELPSLKGTLIRVH
jgi:hypothetical protein